MFVLPLSRSVSRASLNPSFNRANDASFDRFFSNAVAAASTRSPALDVSETDTAYTVAFDVPGVTREQLKVSVEGRRVSVETLDATRPLEAAADVPPGDAPKASASRSLYRERGNARYARTVSLPAEVDQPTSTAKFENGVLTLTLAKKVASGATRIAVN